MNKRFAFVLRLWSETQSDTPDSIQDMRGSLQLANGDKIVYFKALEQIPALLEELTGWSDEGDGN